MEKAHLAIALGNSQDGLYSKVEKKIECKRFFI